MTSFMHSHNRLPVALLTLSSIALFELFLTDSALAQPQAPIISKQVGLSVQARKAWRQSLWTKLNPQTATAPANINFPAEIQLFEAGQLGLGLRIGQSGIDLVSLYDLKSQQELAAEKSMPLFSLKVNPQDLSKEAVWDAKSGWSNTALRRTKNGFEITLTKTQAGEGPFAVILSAIADSKNSAWKWDIKVQNTGSNWSVNEAMFPQVALADLGAHSKAFVPKGPGKLFPNPLESKVAWNDTYGHGSCTMQWMAAYREGAKPTGLYVARHDPNAVLKGLHLNANAELGGTQIYFNQIAENPLTKANGFNLSGEGIWQLLNGDWYDAAQTYKNWVSKNAAWWPKLTKDGRPDTPQWYKQLDVWTTLAGSPEENEKASIEFQKRMGVPVGLHWYLWHSVPFDNDYPHYFPTKPKVRETIATLQNSKVHVIPYINGRLWDTLDKGTEDFEYTSKALPWTAKTFKDGKLTPVTENYFGKEADGRDIYLGVMCPTAKMWQDTIGAVTKRITVDEGADGVYLDQVAATAQVACMDPTHGHALGNGGWWRAGYEQMLTKARQNNRKGTILATECNTEQYANLFDGYLTLHWQDNGQVPAFPAVYGGAIQMFGRLYVAPASLDLRMKSGQQLMYGEQIGWLRDDLEMKNVGELARSYFENVVKTRSKIHRYFYAGEMARPPKLEGTISTVSADWKYGSGVITTDSVLTAAWKQRGESKLLLLFTNVGDDKVDTAFNFDPAAYGIAAKSYTVNRWMGPTGTAQVTNYSGAQRLPVSLAPASIMVCEVSWK